MVAVSVIVDVAVDVFVLVAVAVTVAVGVSVANIAPRGCSGPINQTTSRITPMTTNAIAP